MINARKRPKPSSKPAPKKAAKPSTRSKHHTDRGGREFGPKLKGRIRPMPSSGSATSKPGSVKRPVSKNAPKPSSSRRPSPSKLPTSRKKAMANYIKKGDKKQ